MTRTVVVVEYPSTCGRPTEVYYGYGLVDGVRRSVATELLEAVKNSALRLDADRTAIRSWLEGRGYRELPSLDVASAMNGVDDLVHVFEWNGRVVVRKFVEESTPTRTTPTLTPNFDPVKRGPMKWSDMKFNDFFKSFDGIFDEAKELETVDGAVVKRTVVKRTATSTSTSNGARYRLVSEDDEGLVVEVDVPGFGKDDLTLEARRDGFSVSGAVRAPAGRGRSFRLKLRLAAELDPTTVVAAVADGLLTVRVKKVKGAVGRKVPIS